MAIENTGTVTVIKPHTREESKNEKLAKAVEKQEEVVNSEMDKKEKWEKLVEWFKTLG